MGTGGYGGMRLARGGFVNYKRAEGLVDDVISSIFQNPAGQLYVIGRDWRINRFDGPGFTTVRLNWSGHIVDSSWRAKGIIEDHTGQWWAAASDWLYRFPKLERIEQLAWRLAHAVHTSR